MTLLTTIMTNNDFTFNKELYLQVFGTAMGKIFAPNLANIYLIDLDKGAMEGFRIKPNLFFRFLDDIFFIWPGTREELDEYQDFSSAHSKNADVKYFCGMLDGLAFLPVSDLLAGMTILHGSIPARNRLDYTTQLMDY